MEVCEFDAFLIMKDGLQEEPDYTGPCFYAEVSMVRLTY